MTTHTRTLIFTSTNTSHPPRQTSNQQFLHPVLPFSSPSSHQQSFRSGYSSTTKESSNPLASYASSVSSWTTQDVDSCDGQSEYYQDKTAPDHRRQWQVRGGSRLKEVSSFSERGKHDRRSKRPRPSLNIVTEFTARSTPFHNGNVKIDTVQARRAAIGKRASDSLQSCKAEHAMSTPFDSIRPAEHVLSSHNNKKVLASTQTRQDHRREGLKNIQTRDQNNLRTASPTGKSVLIGLSTTEREIEFQQGSDTPSTALSSARPEPPLSAVRRRKPESSIYSAIPVTNYREAFGANHPSVPDVPAMYLDQKYFTSNLECNSAPDGPNYDTAGKSGTMETLQKQEGLLLKDKNNHLCVEDRSYRPRSQGWWNLMLSPMLSRAGTLDFRRKVEEFTIPPVPGVPRLQTTKVKSTRRVPLDISPVTPRRLGLAQPRSSTWSQWTVENEHDDFEEIPDLNNEEVFEGAEVQDFTKTVNNPVPFHHHDQGLAAEYYHACAIEQLTGQSYFECVNHSCARASPALKSIFHTGKNMPGDSIVASQALGKELDRSATAHPGDQLRSASTDGLTEPDILSPTLRKADSIPVLRARARSISTLGPGSRPPSSQSKDSYNAIDDDNVKDSLRRERSPRTVISLPKNPRPVANSSSHIASKLLDSMKQPIPSPGPITPATQDFLAVKNGVRMSKIQQPTPMGPTAPIIIQNYIHRDGYFHGPVRAGNIRPASFDSTKPIRHEFTSEIKSPVEAANASERKTPFWRRLICTKRTSKEKKPKAARKRRMCICLIFVGLLLMIAGCLAFAMLFLRQGDQTPVQSQWLNLTGYPPMPTGISTIARPDNVRHQAQCVAPSTLWTCALPKERQGEIVPSSSDQPNFRFVISFKNGTVPANMTVPRRNVLRKRWNQNGKVVLSPRASDPFPNEPFKANPDPPPRADQIFLGKTTENNALPYQGEITPFFFSLLPSFPVVPTNSTKRDFGRSYLHTRQDVNLSAAIPAPEVLADGSAAPAQLLPESQYPTFQPVQLYNRGRVDEHYGFYTYYDKSIFLQSTAPIGVMGNDRLDIDPEDENGGASRNLAKVRCTFSQTRFLVRIWTSPTFTGQMLGSTRASSNQSTIVDSATNFTRPGSFPYPVTITVDRHGGDVAKKKAYCYGVNEVQVIQPDVKAVVPEARGVGGSIINPASGLIDLPGDADKTDANVGGVDGGTGGCACVWQNWN